MHPGIVAVENPVGEVDCLLCGKLKPYYFKLSEITEIEDKLGASICLMYGIKASVEILDLLNLSFYCPECTESVVEAHKIIGSIRALKLKLETIKRLSEQVLTEAVQVTDLGAAAGYVLHHELRSKIYEELHTDDTHSQANSTAGMSPRDGEESEPVVANFEIVISSGGSGVGGQETTETGNVNQTGDTKLMVEDKLKDDNEFVLHPHEDDFQNEDFQFGYLQPYHEETSESLVGCKEAETQIGDDVNSLKVNPDEHAELKLKYSIKECYVKVKRIRPTKPMEASEDGTFICPFPRCGKTFARLISVRTHISGSHHGLSQEDIQNRPRKHVCPYCGKGLRKQCTLRDHIRVMHEKIRDFECPKCEKVFSCITDLSKHVCEAGSAEFQEPPGLTVPPSSANPPRPHRQRNPPRSTMLARHMCERCGKRFVKRAEMLNHIQSVHDKLRPYQCDQCGKSFSMNKYLKNHLSYHTAEGLVRPTCNICSRDFVDDLVLKRHMYHHTKEYQFRCEQCEFGCISKSALKKHMFKHVPEKLFKCNECGAEFQHEGPLQRHLKARHGTEEERSRCKCGVCGKEYSDENSRIRHQILHSVTDRSCLCNICGKTFREPHDVRKHVRNCHPDETEKSRVEKPRRKKRKTAQEAQE